MRGRNAWNSSCGDFGWILCTRAAKSVSGACIGLCVTRRILLNIPLSCPSLGTRRRLAERWRKKRKEKERVQRFFATFVRATFASFAISPSILRSLLIGGVEFVLPIFARNTCCSFPASRNANVRERKRQNRFELQNQTLNRIPHCSVPGRFLSLGPHHLQPYLEPRLLLLLMLPLFTPCHLSYPPANAHAPSIPPLLPHDGDVLHHQMAFYQQTRAVSLSRSLTVACPRSF